MTEPQAAANARTARHGKCVTNQVLRGREGCEALNPLRSPPTAMAL
jgi:hypothetical protein